MQPDQARQLAKDSRQIDGWFKAAGLFAMLDDAQKSADVRGDLFEIGTHHGNSAVVLGNMARAGEAIGICDIFGSQTKNVSTSGSGDRAVLERNLASLAAGTPTRIFECLSSELTPDQIGFCRFFHIDGGHLAEEAMNDLVLGDAAVVPEGVIVVDDPYRVEWPGVTEAILSFLTDQPQWVTVAVGLNKQVLARRDHAHIYRQAVDTERAWRFLDPRVYERKTLPIAGDDAAIFYIPTYRQISGTEGPIARGRWLFDAVKRRAGG